MQQEDEMLFAYILRENRSIKELIEADYAFLNDKLATHDRQHPDFSTEPCCAELVPVAEQCDLATQLIVRIGVEQVETRRRRAGQHVLAQALEQDAFQMFHAVFAKPRHMKLHDRAGPSVGLPNRFVPTINIMSPIGALEPEARVMG